MKFSCSAEINLPLDRTVELFTDEENLKHWQQGLVSHTLVSGNLWQTGAKAKVVFQNKKRRIEMTETILNNNLPHELTAMYEHEHMDNTMSSRFLRIEDSRTLYTAMVDYVKLKHLVPRIMFFFMPGFPKKQTQKMVDSFKTFAEKQ